MSRNTKDLSGRRFNRLTVASFAGHSGKKKTRAWRCVCDCGKEIVATAGNLVSGNTKSCGCIKFKYSKGEGILRRVVSMRRHAATKARGIEWTVSDDEAFRVLGEPCFYCGDAPHHGMNDARFAGFKYSGIDRVDNTKGYVPGNIRSCCKACNAAKSCMTVEEFYMWCSRIGKNQWWTRDVWQTDPLTKFGAPEGTEEKEKPACMSNVKDRLRSMLLMAGWDGK